jgi:hypothetical protein
MDPITIAMAGIGLLNGIEKQQQAKIAQDVENSKIAYGPWTGMQRQAIPVPNAPIMEAIGGGLKGYEFAEANKDRDMQREYLGKRIKYQEKNPTSGEKLASWEELSNASKLS